ncbi:Acyl-CoA dehydrogenase domain-containing protein [Paraburkholderia piptadeniae]|uniref:Acyl-CoA dehydrogenase domain-containing protein n=1 Tax=Paraburkholderia piptadeniae TaxID=1701573 RepID=A0A1N7RWT6_9BURK|nr:acyl-CoA dehydrogenase family protein [Paraburkholderia piptadeniae]SIT39234.1 Acyl-CoA dehydrogenase domain-containing protein [Paraburkholderia piptadeniae]
MGALTSLKLCAIPPEDEALRDGVRTFLRESIGGVAPHIRARSWTSADPGFSRELARRGWLGLALPKEYGGGGRSAFARHVVAEELLNVGAPVGAHWIADRQSAPLILRYGSDAQKRFYLPKICRAEAFFCIGMSEPGSGSDLASVRTRAVRKDGGWLLNGQKIWTTNAQHCHYMIALVRTSGAPEDRRQGMSQILIDMRLPGIVVRPITDLCGDAHFCEVFFDDVQLDADALIGEEGHGWQQVTSELAFERSGPERIFSSIVLFDEWLAFVRTSDGRTPHAVRLAGRLLAHLASLRAMSVALTASLAKGESPAVEAALVKDLGTALEQLIPAAIADDLYSRDGQHVPMELLATLTYLVQVAPSFSLRGGTREILRGMIARGLGLR